MLSEQESLAKLQELLLIPSETEWIEFKEAKGDFDTNEIGRYFSALSNEASLKEQPCGWLIFGVTDRPPRRVVGTRYRRATERLQSLKQQIAEKTNDGHTFEEIYEVSHPDGRVVMFQIPAALEGTPTTWRDIPRKQSDEPYQPEAVAYGRHGSSTSKLAVYEKREFQRRAARRDVTRQIRPMKAELGREFDRHPEDAFVGRRAIVNRVRQFIADHDRGVLLIKGHPGKGKSALLAHLARTLPASEVPPPITFAFNHYDYGPDNCVRHLYASLAVNHDLLTPDDARRLSDHSIASDDLFQHLLNTLDEAGKRLTSTAPQFLLIDALDEAKRPAGEKSRPSVFDRLQLPLPPHVYVIATTRDVREIVDLPRRVMINMEDPDLKADLIGDGREYAACQLADLGTTDSLLNEIARLGNGNMLVLKLLCDRIVALGCDSGDVRQILRELSAASDDDVRLGYFYEDYWRRLERDRDTPNRQAIEQVFKILAVAQSAITEDMLLRITGDFAEWQPTRHAAQEYVDFMSADVASQAPERLRLFHNSFRDFLVAKFPPVEHQHWHQRLGDFCFKWWKEYSQPYESEYALRFAPLHLSEGADWEKLTKLLADPDYLEAKAQAGRLRELVDDLTGALSRIPASCVQLPVLRLVNSAIQEELPFLLRHPDSLLGHVWNRLWWTGAELRSIAGDWESRAPRPWIRRISEIRIPASSAISARFRGPGRVSSVAISRDGSLLCVARLIDQDHRGRVDVWDRKSNTHRVLAREQQVPLAEGPFAAALAHTGYILCVAISPNNRWVATGHPDGAVCFWDLDAVELDGADIESQRPVSEMESTTNVHSTSIRHLVFDRHSRQIISADQDGRVYVHLLKTGAPSTELPDADGAAGIALWPDDSTLTAVAADGTIVLWDIHAWSIRERVSFPQELGTGSAITQCTFASDGNHIAMLIADDGSSFLARHDVCVFRLDGARRGGATPPQPTTDRADDSRVGYANTIRDLAWVRSRNRLLLLTCSSQSTEFRDPITLAVTGELPVDAICISSSTESPQFVTGSLDGTAIVWNVSIPDSSSTASRLQPLLYDGFVVNGKYHAALRQDDLSICDPERSTRVFNLIDSDAANPVLALRCAVDDGDTCLVAARCLDSTLRIWKLPNQFGDTLAQLQPQWRIQVNFTACNATAFSPDGQWIAFDDYGGMVRMVRLSDSTEIKIPMGKDTRLEDLAISQSGERLVCLDSNQVIALWDTRQDRRLAKWSAEEIAEGPRSLFTHENPDRVHFQRVAISPDGSWIAAIDFFKQRVFLWRCVGSDGLLQRQGVFAVRCSRAHEEYITSTAMTFSPDNRLLSVAARDNSVEVWDLDERRRRYILGCHSARKEVFDEHSVAGWQAYTENGETRFTKRVLNLVQTVWFPGELHVAPSPADGTLWGGHDQLGNPVFLRIIESSAP